MRIVNIFRDVVPESIALAHVAIMDIIDCIPDYYKILVKLDKAIITDYSWRKFNKKVDFVGPRESFIIIYDFSEETSICDLKFNFASLYAKLFLNNNPGFMDIINEQGKVLPEGTVGGEDDLSLEELFTLAFAVYITDINKEQVPEPVVRFFQRVNQQLKFGHYHSTRV